MTILFGAVFIIISKKKFGSYRNHYTLFNIWWSSLIIYSWMNLSELNTPSLEFYIVALIGLLGFNSSIFFFKGIKGVPSINIEHFGLNNKFFTGANLLVLFFLVPFVIKSIAIIEADSLAVVKATLLDNFENSPLEVIKIYWFCEPVIISSIIIVSFMFLFKKKSLYLLVIPFLNILLFSIAFGGRIQMFRFCFVIITCLYFRKFVLDQEKIVKKRKNLALGLLVCLITVMFIFTQDRSWDSGGADFYRTFNTYFIGSFSLFDKLLHEPELSRLNEYYLFGRATFASFIDPFILAGSKSGLWAVSTSDMGVNIINEVGEKFYEVGKGYKMNAFTTMYYPFMRDFGIWGIFICPFILGSFLNFIYRKIFFTSNFYYFLIYIMSCYIMIFASNRWELVNFWPFGASFFMFLFIRNKSTKFQI